MNFDNLEEWLIDKTNIKQNLDKKFNIELKQAKSNWWLNIIVIVIIVVAFFFLSNIEIRADVRYPIQIALAIITWRLTHSLIKYQKTINENKRKKKQV
jgi:multidrug transporter EmrE-like cation transporter